MLSQDNLKFAQAVSKALAETVCPVPFQVSDLGRTYLIGNGGSASVASHIANDMLKVRGISAHVLTDASVLTCFANDYGYDHAYERMLGVLLEPSDTVICISSSGRSHNICRAARLAADMCEVVTLTGFDADNPLRKIGHCNYWVPSHNYGVVECAHLMILHSIVNPGEL